MAGGIMAARFLRHLGASSKRGTAISASASLARRGNRNVAASTISDRAPRPDLSRDTQWGSGFADTRFLVAWSGTASNPLLTVSEAGILGALATKRTLLAS